MHSGAPQFSGIKSNTQKATHLHTCADSFSNVLTRRLRKHYAHDAYTNVRKTSIRKLNWGMCVSVTDGSVATTALRGLCGNTPHHQHKVYVRFCGGNSVRRAQPAKGNDSRFCSLVLVLECIANLVGVAREQNMQATGTSNSVPLPLTKSSHTSPFSFKTIFGCVLTRARQHVKSASTVVACHLFSLFLWCP